MFCHLHVVNSAESPLVQHLLTYWQSAWEPNPFAHLLFQAVVGVKLIRQCIFLLLNFHLVSIAAQELLQQWMADKLTFDNNFDDEDDELETPRKTQSEIKVEPIFTIS